METTKIEPATSPRQFTSFQEFYPFYLEAHSNRTCRRFHFVGTTLGMGCFSLMVLTLNPAWGAAALFTAYGLAWTGHFLYEKNKPLAWQYFGYSFMGDYKMYFDMATGKLSF